MQKYGHFSHLSPTSLHNETISGHHSSTRYRPLQHPSLFTRDAFRCRRCRDGYRFGHQQGQMGMKSASNPSSNRIDPSVAATSYCPPPSTHTHNTTNTNTILTVMSSRWREGQGRVRHNNQSANREHKTENSSLQYESCCLSVSLPAAAHTTTNHQISLRRH